ncbi:RNA polymerase sigma factor [Rhizobium herbae]|uniref:RNA polymerase sigma-70 factor (ECF subfamily) n=1 Tax=Rhizobium herbae TaxID=508661 RepID=A0ABS4EUL9_9HYPH|nr:RNA polymerase sigma-70 factor (ECF subfamily) [Rhizobium herbae]
MDKTAADIDRSLMLAIATGRQHALAYLVERHGKGLTAFVRRYLGGSREDAEDIVQEVFWTVWRKAAHFDPDKAQVTTWLYRIAANRCIDVGRRNALLRFVGLDAMPADPTLDEPDAEARISGRSELALARKGILGLPQRQRMALLLRAVADLDIAEIAEVMGATGGSVEQLLVRARRTLREHMEKASGGPRV